MYLGELEIKLVTRIEDNDDEVKVNFEGEHTEITINKELLDNLTTSEKGKGNIMDNVNHYFAKIFLAQLSMYGLEYYTVDSVTMAMRVLAHNLRENAIKKAFNCSGGDSIKLNILFNDDVTEDEPEKLTDKTE